MVADNQRTLYTQKDYDCQRCGAAESEAMRKRVRDFVRPLCDGCVEAMGHEGHGPDELVTIVTTTHSHDESGKPTQRRTEQRIRYADWEFRCGVCSVEMRVSED